MAGWMEGGIEVQVENQRREAKRVREMEDKRERECLEERLQQRTVSMSCGYSATCAFMTSAPNSSLSREVSPLFEPYDKSQFD